MRLRLRGDDHVDEIRLHTVPRFKTSGLSGDEWRFHVEAVAYRKGREVGRTQYGWITAALERIDTWVKDELLCPVENVELTHDLCDQPGCDQPWTVKYRMIRRGCGDCGSVHEEEPGWENERAFCADHAKRGDQDVDDNDDMYQPIDGGPPAEHVVRDDDVSPSAFGGVIDMTAKETK